MKITQETTLEYPLGLNDIEIGDILICDLYPEKILLFTEMDYYDILDEFDDRIKHIFFDFSTKEVKIIKDAYPYPKFKRAKESELKIVW